MLMGLSNLAKGATLCTAIALCAAGCASTPVPNEQLAVAKSSVQRAEGSGAPELAPVEMSTARQELASAEKATADGMAQPKTHRIGREFRCLRGFRNIKRVRGVMAAEIKPPGGRDRKAYAGGSHGGDRRRVGIE